ncbi:glycosyltransferase [Pseudoflavonifractor sp. HCP28S3_F10]|uniref:glycosyltransferase n=1 Tax=Pseudoflavonifractor sp. HCP28S3_F10 TaxID=3438947 RepID=UPI003F8AB298
MKQLLCISDTPWAAVPTRTQQLMARLRDVQILYFAPPARRGDDSYKKPGRRVRPGLMVYTLPPVLEAEEHNRLLFQSNQRRLCRFICRAMELHGFREPILWCSTPRAVHFLDRVPCRGIVYDCARDWSHLPDRWESDLTLAADVAFAASPELADHLSPCSDNVALLPNGANYSMFSRTDLEIPLELAGLDAPVLGYSGTLWRDLDLSPLLRAAREHPDAVFLLVGRREHNPLLHRLEELPNVRFLGEKRLIELPEYLGRFDVCLSLLRSQSPDNDVLPPRIFEYLSTGKPIVSMLAPGQVEPFPDVIYGAHSPAEFSQLCGSALAETGSWARERRRTYGEAGSWSRRAQEVERILTTIGLF